MTSSVETPPDQAPVIRTPRLELRPPSHGDIDDIVEGIGEPQVSRMLARVPFPYGREDAEAFVALAAERNERYDDLLLMIQYRATVIGGIGLHGLREPVDFGYWIARPYWGRGFATEAASGLLAFAFENFATAQVASGAFCDNPASLRVQQKLGFRTVGTSRVFSLARGEEVEQIDTLLARTDFRMAAA